MKNKKLIQIKTCLIILKLNFSVILSEATIKD